MKKSNIVITALLFAVTLILVGPNVAGFMFALSFGLGLPPILSGIVIALILFGIAVLYYKIVKKLDALKNKDKDKDQEL